ncbi:ABC transporter substrate-binding protein [Geminicoccus flavidas]|uniref:ABC transporter substrate-binding protein n=1 Tax=Geminicoccus flavidas TaxID=2506407 RepID=UPI00135A8D32|nr:ABC transporter substrate-binding protein [Geminicoccus flavidas]
MHSALLTASCAAALIGAWALPAGAAGRLTLYCVVDEAWCQLMTTEFEKETGISVAMTRKSSGETYAQVKSEADNPKGDVWWGGTGDPHLQAAEEGLTEVYESPANADLHDWALAQYQASGGRTVGIYAGALGFGYNTELLAQKGLEAPKCWADLIKPEFKGEIQMANPNSSGTAYTALATFVQLMGEEEGFDYLKALHANINQYTKSGSAPIKAAAQGETMVGIVFQHDAVTMKATGAPIEVVSPCEGTGYEIGSMSIIAGARNIEEAEQFYDFALRPDVQEKARQARSYQVPSNKNAEPPPESPKLSDIKLIDYDFAKYGSSEERSRLLKRWDDEVSALPR